MRALGEGGSDVDVAQLVALGIGILGVAGVIFTALRYNRDDTTAILSQQEVILGDMRSLNDELRLMIADLRARLAACEERHG